MHNVTLRIKKYLLLPLALLTVLSSCSDDEETEISDYCYISGVTLGTVRRTMYTKSSEGTDSTYYTTFTGSNFAFTIDQRKQKIENEDSLLFNSDLRSVLLTVNYVGALLVYRPAADTTATWQTYNSKDSIDLRQPLHLKLFTEGGRLSRQYLLKVNVHQQEGDSLNWRKTAGGEVLAGMTEAKSVVLRDTLTVIGRMTDGSIHVATRPTLDLQGAWSTEPTDLPVTADLETLRGRGDSLFVSLGDGSIYATADGANWNQLAGGVTGLKLVAVTDDLFYALIGEGLFRSVDAAVWEAETLDAPASNLPRHGIQSVVYEQTNGNRRLVLLGARENVSAADTTAAVWCKVWNARTPEEQAEWVYVTPTEDNLYQCPLLKQLTLLHYDGKLMAFGGESEENCGSHQSLDSLYVSNDHGITWRSDGEIKLPTSLKGKTGAVTASVDGQKHIWLTANQEVWRGRLNRLGFVRQ